MRDAMVSKSIRRLISFLIDMNKFHLPNPNLLLAIIQVMNVHSTLHCVRVENLNTSKAELFPNSLVELPGHLPSDRRDYYLYQRLDVQSFVLVFWLILQVATQSRSSQDLGFSFCFLIERIRLMYFPIGCVRSLDDHEFLSVKYAVKFIHQSKFHC